MADIVMGGVAVCPTALASTAAASSNAAKKTLQKSLDQFRVFQAIGPKILGLWIVFFFERACRIVGPMA